MKKIILGLLMIGSSALAGTPEVFKAVLDMPEMKNFSTIQKMEVRQVFRCPKCYEIAVQGVSSCGTVTSEILVHTKQNSEDQSILAFKVEQ